MGNTNDRPETDLTLQVFRSYQLTREEIALSEFINRIRTGMYESVVAVVRRLAARGDLERANAAKGTMPSVCVSALFGGRRTAECVTRYLPLLPLDFDGLSSLAEAERLRTRAMTLPFTLAAFVTAKGRGVKVICRTPGNPLALTGEALKEMHRALYDRLADLYERRLGCKADRSGSDLTRTVLASWVLPKAVNQVALILVGPQGVYKTTWITSLLPPELGSYLYSGPFNPQDKDHILNLSRCALINCEEIDALSGERLNRFKSILTQSSTNERAAYGRNTEFCVRCASFAGSTNQTELIADPTGLRRWLIVQVEAIESPFDRPFAYAGIYAQAYALVRQGFRWWSDTADIRRMNRRNERFEMKSVEEELITTWYRPPREGEPYRLLTAADVLQRLSGMVRVPLSKNNIGRVLRKLGYKFHKTKGLVKYEVVELTFQDVELARNS